MSGWSHSHFLQSLGWATLNSFWQMGLLWCGYLAVISLFKLSSAKKYQMSVLALTIGFLWFSFTLLFFYEVKSFPALGFIPNRISLSGNMVNIFLISSSIAYLTLLIFPSYNFCRNWIYIRKIKKVGLEKADLSYRLFVQKIASQLGIKRRVLVYLSGFVKSPMTIGYFKPIILLPIAAFNNLTTQQAEAVLLHELSHIKRYDYLINLATSLMHTFLYFNPFVRHLVRAIEEERENCCDQLVIHYGYNKVSYASALLSLEKVAARHVLVIGAAGKKYLLNRIEKIIGMEKKNSLRLNQFGGLLAAFFCILVFNSVLIIKQEKRTNYGLSYNDLVNPFHLFDNIEEAGTGKPLNKLQYSVQSSFVASGKEFKDSKPRVAKKEENAIVPQHEENLPTDDNLITVGYDEIDGNLSQEQKSEIKTTVAATKKVVGNLQWEQVENSIADALTNQEKEIAKEDYLKEMNNTINWKNIENNLKAQYDNINWDKVNSNLNNALTIIQIDSIQKSYNAILAQIDKANVEISKNRNCFTPLPDESIDQMQKARVQLVTTLKQLKAIKSKKVVRL